MYADVWASHPDITVLCVYEAATLTIRCKEEDRIRQILYASEHSPDFVPIRDLSCVFGTKLLAGVWTSFVFCGGGGYRDGCHVHA
jgi:hypothetical protein